MKISYYPFRETGSAQSKSLDPYIFALVANSESHACVSDSDSNPSHGHSNSATRLRDYAGRSGNYSGVR